MSARHAAVSPVPDTYFVIGESRTNSDDAITKIYGFSYPGFELDGQTETVLALNCTHTLDITEILLRQWFVGKNFVEIDGWLEDALNRRYGGLRYEEYVHNKEVLSCEEL